MNALLLSPEELAQLHKHPASLGAMVYRHEKEGSVFLLSDWVGKLHEALTGSATGGDPPLAWAVHGGAPMDCDGTPVVVLAHAQVRAVSKALNDLGEEGVKRLVRQRLEARNVWAEGIERLDYLVSRILPAFQNVALVYSQAAKEGYAVVKYHA